MPIRPSVATAALIIATLATAAGLNLAVMGLGQPTDGEVSADVGAPAPAGDAEVQLTSGSEVPQTAAPAPVQPAEPLAVALVSQEATTPANGGGSDDDDSDSGGDDPADHDSTDDSDDDSEGHDSDDSTDDDSDDAEGPDTTVATPPSMPPAADTSTTVPSTTGPSTTSGSPSTAAPTSPAPPQTSPPPSPSPSPTAQPATEYLTYEFEGVASIVVARHADDRLEYWSVTPDEGWAFLVEDRGPDQVKIKFRPKAGGEEAEFEVEFEDGRLKVKREY